ncbi:unnamed protein product [Orchesella dallaii]|uniref:Uncharacterized protein n=1 Tax=Orchesella dallaii TaxID=48710 RepID=A0ABP1QF85_9HEXA
MPLSRKQTENNTESSNLITIAARKIDKDSISMSTAHKSKPRKRMRVNSEPHTPSISISNMILGSKIENNLIHMRPGLMSALREEMQSNSKPETSSPSSSNAASKTKNEIISTRARIVKEVHERMRVYSVHYIPSTMS